MSSDDATAQPKWKAFLISRSLSAAETSNSSSRTLPRKKSNDAEQSDQGFQSDPRAAKQHRPIPVLNPTARRTRAQLLKEVSESSWKPQPGTPRVTQYTEWLCAVADTVLQRVDLKCLRMLADATWWKVIAHNSQVTALALNHPHLGHDDVVLKIVPYSRNAGLKQLMHELDAAAELSPNAINSTIATAWGDGHHMYCLSPYAGDTFCSYDEDRSLWLQQLGAAVEQGGVGLEAAVNRATEVYVDDFMLYVTSMLLNTLQMQTLPTPKAYRDFKPENVLFNKKTKMWAMMDHGLRQDLYPKSPQGFFNGNTPGYWDPFACQLDANGQPLFRTLQGAMWCFNTSTDIALLFLAGLEILGTFPPELTKAYAPMREAGPGDRTLREKVEQAAAALLDWAGNLTSDSPAFACLPEELRMMLPRTFGINMSARPAGPMDYLQVPCFQPYISKIGDAIAKHSAEIQEQYRAIQGYMGPQLTADDHPVRALQLHQAKQYQKQAEIAAAQRAAQEMRVQHKLQQQQEELQQALLLRQQQKQQQEQRALKLSRQQEQERQALLQQQQEQQAALELLDRELEQQALLQQQEQDQQAREATPHSQQQHCWQPPVQHVSKAARAPPAPHTACRVLPRTFDACKAAVMGAGLKDLVLPESFDQLPVCAQRIKQQQRKEQQHTKKLEQPRLPQLGGIMQCRTLQQQPLLGRAPAHCGKGRCRSRHAVAARPQQQRQQHQQAQTGLFAGIRQAFMAVLMCDA